MNWYKIAKVHKLEELFLGKSDKENFTEQDANPKELAMGIEVEKEHTPNEDIAKFIALDHLAEIPDYYTRLKKMEEDAISQK